MHPLLLLIALYQPLLASSSQQLCASSPCGPARHTAGSPCTSEGKWNCLTHSWQRCADGAWTVEMPCAEGTVCVPAGLTHDLMILHEDKDDSSSPSAASTSAHQEAHSAGGTMLARAHGGLALAALIAHIWAVIGS